MVSVHFSLRLQGRIAVVTHKELPLGWPMTAPESFADLMARLRQGDQDAAAQLFQQYARRLIGLAHRRLDDRLRQKADPEEVMQSVLKSFFVRQRQGQFELDNWDSLWALLVRITLHKCGHRVEYYR